MRVAFVGLSSPTAYFYDHKRKYLKKSSWQWTPILESPQGLATLFDEILFLHEALCPSTMKTQPFVRFLLEDSELLSEIKPLIEYSQKGFGSLPKKDKEYFKSIINPISLPTMDKYRDVIRTVIGKEPSREYPIDNHSLGFNVSGIDVNGDSFKIVNVIIDFLIVKKLNQITKNKVELVTNRFTTPWLRQNSCANRDAQLSEGITISRIPVLHNPEGPEMMGIENIRKNIFLRDFRKKITSKSKENKELQSAVDEIEKEFESYRNRLLIEKQKDARLMTSCAKNAVSFAVGTIIPGASELKSLIDDKKTRTMSWTGFIASLEAETIAM